MRKNRVIFTDLPLGTTEPADISETVVFSPETEILPCRGCMDCWFKTPAVCSLPDAASHLSEALAACDELLVVSACAYGCLSPFVKNLFDRSVSYVLPFFKKKGESTAHYPRYEKELPIRFLIYGNVSPGEKETLGLFAEACAEALCAVKKALVFYPDFESAVADAGMFCGWTCKTEEKR